MCPTTNIVTSENPYCPELAFISYSVNQSRFPERTAGVQTKRSQVRRKQDRSLAISRLVKLPESISSRQDNKNTILEPASSFQGTKGFSYLKEVRKSQWERVLKQKF
jgi:hypothetical protein